MAIPLLFEDSVLKLRWIGQFLSNNLLGLGPISVHQLPTNSKDMSYIAVFVPVSNDKFDELSDLLVSVSSDFLTTPTKTPQLQAR